MIYVMVWITCVITVEAVVEIVVASKLFLNFRAFMVKNYGLFGELFTCGYCFSVWVAAAFAWSLPGQFTEYYYIDLAIKIFTVHRLSNILHELFSRWFKRLPKVIITQNITQEPIRESIIDDSPRDEKHE